MNEELFNLFEEHLELHDRSDKTIKSYMNAMRDFKKWLLEDKEISDLRIIAFREIKNYREFLIHKYSPASVNQKLCAIKQFYRFLFGRKIISTDPSETIKIQKISDNIKSQYLTRAEELAVMNRAKMMGKREFCIIMILLKLGLRPSEVAKLTLNCLHLQGDPTLIIKNSKRNKSRFLPIPPDTVQAIKDWLIIRNQSTKIYHHRSQYVFTSQRAEKMGERAIQRVVEKIAKKENIKLYCTRLRSSFANDLLQETKIPISILSTLMGHENVSTTGRYLTASEHDVRKYVNKLSEL